MVLLGSFFNICIFKANSFSLSISSMIIEHLLDLVSKCEIF